MTPSNDQPSLRISKKKVNRLVERISRAAYFENYLVKNLVKHLNKKVSTEEIRNPLVVEKLFIDYFMFTFSPEK